MSITPNELRNTYKTEPAGSQKRLKEKVVLNPTIDLSRYRFSANIDTVVIRIELGRNTKPGTLKAKLGPIIGPKPFVGALDKKAIESGGGCAAWDVTIQDPTRPMLERLCEALREEYGLESTPMLVQVDVAVDASLSGLSGASDADMGVANSVDARKPIYETLKRHLRPGADVLPGGARWWGRLSSGDDAAQREKRRQLGLLLKSMSEGSTMPSLPTETMWLGEKSAAVCWVIYDKVRDQSESLPTGKHRIRLEVKAKLEGLQRIGVHDLQTVDDLWRFDWGRIRKDFFGFELPVIPESEQDAAGSLWDRYAMYGIFDVETTKAYSELNDRLRKALYGLSKKLDKVK